MVPTKRDIRPTQHYLRFHADVPWDLVITAILSPSKTHRNLRRGKDRFTYLKIFQRYVIEVHSKYDEVHDTIWVINAFKVPR